MEKNVAELLKPRYKCVVKYPKSYFNIGEVITDEDFMFWNADESVENYPEVFKRLEWHEERKPEEMPYAIEVKNEGYKSWENGYYRYAGMIDGFHHWYVKTDPNKFFPQKLFTKMGDYEPHLFGLKNARPITKEEYESFINSQK